MRQLENSRIKFVVVATQMCGLVSFDLNLNKLNLGIVGYNGQQYRSPMYSLKGLLRRRLIAIVFENDLGRKEPARSQAIRLFALHLVAEDKHALYGYGLLVPHRSE